MTIGDLEKPEAVEEYDDNGLTRSPTAVDDIDRADALHTTRSGTSAKVKATIGNVLSATASRVTTRHITDPGPAPDGMSPLPDCLLQAKQRNPVKTLKDTGHV
jgi:hypothetical protein